ncbi:MAG: phage holin family protein [Candidatus Pacearchaeota archaeon]|nr:phage holin family protein [Candidatus Pacearchaeota archaeon]
MGLKNIEIKNHPILLMLVVGIVAGMGQLLASDEKLSPRIVVGRAISSGSLGLVAGMLLIWYPNIDPFAMCGLAALLASIGTSGLERIIQIVWGRTK